MAVRQRSRLPKNILNLRTICKEVGISYEDGQELIEAILCGVEDGYLVNIPRFGRFWLAKVAGHMMKMPGAPKSPVMEMIKIEPRLKLRFRTASTYRERLKKRARGRGKGTV
jgi:nucleoid DNA-binding protein